MIRSRSLGTLLLWGISVSQTHLVKISTLLYLMPLHKNVINIGSEINFHFIRYYTKRFCLYIPNLDSFYHIIIPKISNFHAVIVYFEKTFFCEIALKCCGLCDVLFMMSLAKKCNICVQSVK